MCGVTVGVCSSCDGVTEAARDDIEVLSSVGALARAAGLSRSRFAERCSACYGETASTWLRHHRMRHAERLLSAEGPSVAQAAERRGYESESTFRQAFKRVLSRPARARAHR